jgi:hypothetical protein
LALASLAHYLRRSYNRKSESHVHSASEICIGKSKPDQRPGFDTDIFIYEHSSFMIASLEATIQPPWLDGPDTTGWPEWEQEVFVRLVGYLDKEDTSQAAIYLNILLRFLRDRK